MSNIFQCGFIIFRERMLLAPRSCICGQLLLRCKTTSTVSPAPGHDPDAPIKFSTSPAGWGHKNEWDSSKDAPLYKQIILWGTFFFCLHYFMFFRQPNDIDEDLDMPLGKRILWIYELNLMKEKNKLLTNGNSASSVDEDLKKIYELRKKYKYD